MPLELEQRQQLQAALVSAFDNAGLRRLTGLELDTDLELVTTDGDRRQRVYELIAWAERSGKTAALIRAACVQNPTNPLITQLAAAALRWQVCLAAGDELFIRHELAPPEIEKAYLSDLVAKYKEWEQKYTPLEGMAAVEDRGKSAAGIVSPAFMPAGFEKLVEHGYGPDKRVERVPVDDLREALAAYKRLVVLGEPGSGKTTTLWRLVHDYAAAAQVDPAAPIPVLVPLGGYTGEESALAYAAQHAGGLGLHLPAYLRGRRLVLLLDGMNEMPRNGYAARVARIQALLDRFPDALAVVTCRALDYSEELKLEKLDVKPLDVLRQRAYLHRYLGEAKGDKLFWQLAGGEAAADLWEAWQRLGMTFEQLWTSQELPDNVRRSLTWPQRDAWAGLRRDGLPPLLALGANPFLLVMFAEVFARRGELPQNRGRLFGAFAGTLLAREQERHPDGWPGADVLLAAYAGLAFAMQQSGERGTAVARDWAVQTLAAGGADPGPLLYLGASATLLDLAGGKVRFSHQLLQEYFAAVAWQARIAAGDDLTRYWPDGWVSSSGWEETAVLLAGLLQDMTPFVTALLAVNPPLAARCIVESGGAPPETATVEKVQSVLVEIATSLTAPVSARHSAGNALNRVGDPRPGIGLRADGLPDIAWCPVAAGEFLMGSTKETDPLAYGNEMPQHRAYLPEYRMAKYPVTNMQYQAFVDDGGYTEKWRTCWSEDGWQWKEQAGIQGPRRYGGEFDLPNHPVVGVSWYEAVAFCSWLGRKLSGAIMLPSEAQWEKAARGPDGLRYPWGSEITPEHANYSATGLGATSAAGISLQGASSFGLLDAAGNVLEWTATKWVSSYKNYLPDDRLEGNAFRTLRGGAWYGNVIFVRCAYRYNDVPANRLSDVGFRVVSPGG